jgi:phospholipase C
MKRALVLVAVLSSCSDSNTAAGPDLAIGPVGGGGDGSDMASAPDLAVPAPPSKYPIDHIIVVVKENHTFDNYFGSFPGAEGTNMAKTSTGTVAVAQPPTTLSRDLCHEHSCALADWNGGAMDHWDIGDTRNASDKLAFAQYLESDIPNYWKYARTFGLADHFFSSMLGPSFPGHMFVLAAQTGWATGNPSGSSLSWGCDQSSSTTQEILTNGTCSTQNVFPCYDFATIFDILPAGVTWKFYGSTLPPGVGEVWSMLDAITHIRNQPTWMSNVVDASQFDSDVDNGTLPNVVFLVNQFLESEHPPLNICTGENWTVGHLNHVMAKPELWAHTAIFMTYDDFGGWYDHVAPPKQYGCDSTHPYGLGFRLPLIIVSPYAKNAVYKNVAHQASIPKFIESLWGLAPLADKDPAAQDGDGTDDLLGAFDFQQAPIAPLTLTQRSCTGAR